MFQSTYSGSSIQHIFRNLVYQLQHLHSFPTRRSSDLRCGEFLPDTTSSSSRGRPLLTATRDTTAANCRGASHRLCSGPLPGVLADDFGLLALLPSASWTGECRRLRLLQPASDFSFEVDLN